MKLIYQAVFKNRKHRLQIFLVLVGMCLLTFSSQLEILALGVITNKGPEFFELFAPLKDGKLQRADSITKEEVDQRWDQIDTKQQGSISKEEALEYLAGVKKTDLVGRIMNFANTHIPLTSNYKVLAFFLAFVALFKAISLFFHRFFTRLTAIRVSRDLREKYFEHIQTLPMSFYHEYNIGSLSSRVVGDAALISEAVNACLINYFQTPFTVLTTLVICFLTSWELSLMIFIGFPIIVFPIVFLARKVRKISRKIQQNQEKFASVLLDFIAGVQTVKVFAMEGFSLKKYREHNDRMAQLEQKSAKYDVSSRPIVHTIGMFFLAMALVYGLYVLKMNVSEVLVYCGLMYVLYEPIKKFAEENTHIQRGIAAAERMHEVMSLKPQIHDKDGSQALETFNKEIEFKDVWFKYNQEWVLKGVSFKIKKGEAVALVGPTGSGKSTIVQLLPRLYEPQKGEILIDGVSFNQYTQRSLREKIAFVPQKPFLFLDTIAENISFGQAFSREQVRFAAKQANADEFIDKMPQGYDTELNVGGSNLSGGQQQRLAIARALIKQAPILVLDEATSSLDTVSEAYIKTAIRQLRGKMTQILIAHRLTTIEDADRIIYLENGTISGEGTLQELLNTNEGFRKMWQLTLIQQNIE